MDIPSKANGKIATSPSIELGIEHHGRSSSPGRVSSSVEGLKNKLRYWEELSWSYIYKYVPRTVPKIEVRSVFGWTDVGQDNNTYAEPDDLDSTLSRGIGEKVTYSKQDQLPRLPVPQLSDTCRKYLTTIEPLITSEEYAENKKLLDEFCKAGGVGEYLQERLLELDNTDCPSWLEAYWDDAYLFNRDPIAVNVNYFFAFEDDPIAEKNYQTGRAASLLRGALVFKKLLDAEQLDPDMERSNPLCMSQYPRMFAATRVPGEERDRLVTYTKYRPSGRSSSSKTTEYVDSDPRHVVVMYRNQFYRFDAFGENKKLLSIPQIEQILEEIKRQTHMHGDNCPPVGVLTGWKRAEWHRVREMIISFDSSNEQALETIQSALLIVCLDDSAPQNLDEMARVVLHGPCTNRWFDKHNLIICENGKAGMNFEHAVGDGSSTLRLADEMYKYSVRHGSIPSSNSPRSPSIANGSSPNSSSSGVYPEKITFKLNSQIEDEIATAYFGLKDLILSNEAATLLFSRYGGQFIKDSNFSPDAFVQIAVQLAYYKLFGRCDATYESGSTKQFLHGRTETVRTVSNQSVAFCKSTTQPLFPSSQNISANQLTLLQEAANSHVKYMREAKEGRGVDRHLFGLRMLAEKHKSLGNIAEIPPIFKTEAYRKSSHWNISTSHCGSPSISLFGFGPVVHDGFGVGYMIKNNSISFTITSKYDQTAYSSALFATLLEQSLLHMKAIVLSNPATLTAPPKSLNFTHPTNTTEFHYHRDTNRST